MTANVAAVAANYGTAVAGLVVVEWTVVGVAVVGLTVLLDDGNDVEGADVLGGAVDVLELLEYCEVVV
jgi:hypothetical protein